MTFSVSLVSLRDKGEGGSKIAMTAEGASIYDVRKTFGFFYHPPSSDFYVPFVRKFGVFFYPPSPLCADVIYGSPLTGSLKEEDRERQLNGKWKRQRISER